MGNRGGAVLRVGKIVDFPRSNSTRLYDCPLCPGYRRDIEALRNAIREHRAAHDAARSFVDEAAANTKLWEIIGA